MRLCGFSKHTIQSYTECVTEYLSLLNKPLPATTEYDVRAFQLYLQMSDTLRQDLAMYT